MKKCFTTATIAFIIAAVFVLILLFCGVTTLFLPSAYFVLGFIGLLGTLLATSCICTTKECPATQCFIIRKPLTLWGLALLIFAVCKSLHVYCGILCFGLGTAFIGAFLILGTLISLIRLAVCFPGFCCTRDD